ncbi:MAG TPA: ROK family protein [Acetobacteraceae bacterium]|nr:ROK family protein [Acetobacteraceae bacterium]
MPAARSSQSDKNTRTARPVGPLTLAIDVGGTHLKAGILAPTGTMTAGPVRVDTPHPATPAAVVDALVDLASPLRPFDRISIGFPGVVRDGRVLTAPNLGTQPWHAFPLADTIAEKLGAPARLENDATVQGLGVINGRGLECVITLGTGMGFALFQDGRPAPHLELSQHPVHGNKTYDRYIGHAAMRAVGRKSWNRRVRKAIDCINTLTTCDTLYIGGGNSKYIRLDLPATVQIVSNEAGITGGIRLWDALPDHPAAGQTP